MEIIGRVTKDAIVTKLKDERQVVNFSIAMNDYYKPKGSEESVKITPLLTKGTLVELYGRIGVNAYNDQQGEAKGSLTFHVNNIKLHGKPKPNDEQTILVSTADVNTPADDLPF